MSTDTENGPLATETKRIAVGMDNLRAWAIKNKLPFEDIAAAFGGDEPRSIEQPAPPNHTTVCWFDIHRPDGGKLHVVVRGGATRGSVLDTVFTASNAFGDLVEQGWMPADRRPRTQEEIAETKAKLEEKLSEPAGAKRKAAKKAKTDDRQAGATEDRQDVEGSTRTVQVESILKRLTDSGNVNYLVKGHPWSKYGVTAWPDSSQLEKLAAVVGIMKTWKVGQQIDFTEVDIKAVVRLKLKEDSDPPKLIPDKVIDFVGKHALPDVPEDYDDGS